MSADCLGDFLWVLFCVLTAVGLLAEILGGAALACLTGDDAGELLAFVCGSSLELPGLCEDNSSSACDGGEFGFTETEVSAVMAVVPVVVLFIGEATLDLSVISFLTGAF